MINENDQSNRMATGKKRGRPTDDESAKKPPFVLAEHVELPPTTGIKCHGCGRAMVPRILRTIGPRRRVACQFCGREHDAIYDANGVALIRLA